MVTRQREYPPVALPELHGGVPQVLEADAVAPPVDVVLLLLALALPVAHVEGDDRHPDVVSRLLVHVGQLQPRVVLLLPRPQRLLLNEVF